MIRVFLDVALCTKTPQSATVPPPFNWQISHFIYAPRLIDLEDLQAMRTQFRLLACLAVVLPMVGGPSLAQDVRVPSSRRRDQAVLCAGGEAGGTRRWSTSMPRAWSRTAFRCSTIRSSAVSSAAAGRRPARSRCSVRSVPGSWSIRPGSSSPITTSSRMPTRSRYRSPTSANSRPRSCCKDQRSDLAVLRIKDGHEKFAAIDFGDSDALQVGDVVLAIGNPFGVGQTVTHGIVSAVARTQVGITDYQFFIQTDAAINPGNSGGALVDLAGKLVGINTAIFSRSGGSQGIGFAIPANMVRARGRLGAGRQHGGAAALARRQAAGGDAGDRREPQPSSARSARWWRRVAAKSPAARAGLRTGDLIVAVDGQAVDDPNAFDYRFATKPLGGQTQIGVMRGGREAKLAVALEAAPETPARGDRDQGALAAARRQSREPVAGAGRRIAARYRCRGRRRDRGGDRVAGAEFRPPEGRRGAHRSTMPRSRPRRIW